MRKFLVGIMGVGMMVMATGPASAASANQRFVITETPRGETFAAIGPISGIGTEVTLSESGDEDSFRETTRADFPKGSVFFTINGSTTGFKFNDKTCIGSATGKGTFDITGGTKAYKGAKGSGTFTFRANFTGCHEDDDEGTFSSIVRARGRVTLGS